MRSILQMIARSACSSICLLACAAVLVGVSLATVRSEAQARSTTIVALGASNTQGKGVASSQAWPARLEALLRARGINASVINAGINGDTTGGMLARLDSAVPSGTRVVILQPGGNDRRRGVDEGERGGNIEQIKRRLAARNIRVVMMGGALFQSVKRSHPQADGIHITPEGHAKLAANILPQVVAAIGR